VKKSSILAEGAVVTSIYAVLLMVTLYVPLLSMISIWALTVPFTIFIIRHGVKSSYVFLSVAFILTIIIGGLLALPVIISTVSVGIVLGILYQKKKSSFGILLGGTLTYLINFVFFYGVSIILFQINPYEVIKKSIKQSLALTEEFSEFIGQDASQQLEQFEEALEIIVYIIPTVIVIASVIFALITQIVTNGVLKRFKYNVPDWLPFREWSFPKSFIWYYLVTILLMMSDPEKGSALFIAVWNLFYLIEFILIIQGIAFVFYYFWKKKKSKVIPIIITIFSLLIPILLYVIRFLGIIDLGFDLRKRIKS
jgi:uncharacterized protein YybS (DUF2232 family)